MANDNFNDRHEYLERLIPQIRQKIITKNNLEKNSIAHNTTLNQLNNLMSVYEEKLLQLREELVRHSNEKKYPRSELDRRQDMINQITTTYKQLQDEIENPARNSRNDLLKRNNRNSLWDEDRSKEGAKSFTLGEARDQQQLLIREQDSGLDSLGEIICKQKYMAQDICNEIDIQDEILDDINDAMDQTDERLLRNTRNIRKVSVKTETCSLWMVIILLFAANIILLII